MKRIITKALKIFGIILLLLVVSFAILYVKESNYTQYSLKVNASKFPNVKTEADIEILAQDLVKEMSLEEKIDQMYGEKQFEGYSKLAINWFVNQRFPHIFVGKNERLNIPPWVLSDGPRGARVMDKSIDAVTTFPVGMARGASWDIDLEFRINDVIAKEMRANQVNYAATPCINLLRHPAWGRAQETYGEDPWLLGEFGVAAVKGLEKNNVMACPKHYALNSIDNSRFVLNVNLDERALREVYLPHFKKTIQKGKPASLMSAYNKVLGEYCAENKYLLNDILRDEWGFEGFVSTDWVQGAYDGIKAIKAGLEVEMPIQNVYDYDKLKKGISSGVISEKDIDEIVTRSLKTRLKYAFIDDEDNYPLSLILDKKHINLARETSEKSMVLIKNEGILPFSKSSNKKIAVIGKLANVENTGDLASSNCAPPYVITPYQGIKNYQEKLGNEVILNDGSNLEEAKQLAARADEVVLIVGYTYKDEGEYMIISRDAMDKSAIAGKPVGEKGLGGDRENLNLVKNDEALINAIGDLNDKTALVYIGGSAIDMTKWEEKIPAILYAWYPGMEGGNALANILYGDVNPSGKLTFSVPKNVKDYPYFTPYTKEIDYEYYHGYTLFDKKNIEVAYPFGYGLSYTKYEYSSLKTDKKEILHGENLNVSVDVTNIGEVKGEEIVQLYIGFKNSKVNRPVKLLRGFSKDQLQVNETKTISFDVDTKDLAWYNPESKKWEIEFMEYELYVGKSSSSEDLLNSTFKIVETIN